MRLRRVRRRARRLRPHAAARAHQALPLGRGRADVARRTARRPAGGRSAWRRRARARARAGDRHAVSSATCARALRGATRCTAVGCWPGARAARRARRAAAAAQERPVRADGVGGQRVGRALARARAAAAAQAVGRLCRADGRRALGGARRRARAGAHARTGPRPQARAAAVALPRRGAAAAARARLPAHRRHALCRRRFPVCAAGGLRPLFPHAFPRRPLRRPHAPLLRRAGLRHAANRRARLAPPRRAARAAGAAPV